MAVFVSPSVNYNLVANCSSKQGFRREAERQGGKYNTLSFAGGKGRHCGRILVLFSVKLVGLLGPDTFSLVFIERARKADSE